MGFGIMESEPQAVVEYGFPAVFGLCVCADSHMMLGHIMLKIMPKMDVTLYCHLMRVIDLGQFFEIDKRAIILAMNID